MSTMKKKALVCAACMVALAVIMFALMLTTKFAFVMYTSGDTQYLSEFDQGITFFELSGDMSNMASYVSELKAAAIITNVAVYLTYFFMILSVVASFIVIPRMILKNKDDINVSDFRTVDTFLWLPPLSAYITCCLPLVFMESYICKVTRVAYSVRFTFVGGVNFLYIAIGAFILPKIFRFVCRKFI